MRIGIFGAGRIASVHAQACLGLEEVDRVVVADPSPGRAQDLARRVGVEFVDSVDALLLEALDGVVIASSTPTHAGLLGGAIELGLPTLCEKPVTLDMASTAQLADAAAAAGVPVQVGFQRRSDPGYREARRLIEGGALGSLHSIRSSTLDPVTPPEEYLRGSGGLFMDCGVHDIDSIRWLSSSEVVAVSAAGHATSGSVYAAVGDYETASAVLELTNGCLAHVCLSRLNGAGSDDRVEVFGSWRSVTAGLTSRSPLERLDPGEARSAGLAYPDFIDRFAEAFQQQIRTFADVIAGRATPPATVVDSLRAMEVAVACERSAREGRRVELGPEGAGWR